MLAEPGRGWLPQVLGVVALLLALDRTRWLMFVPPAHGEEYVLGMQLVGQPAWAATTLLAVLCAWISAGCFRRRRMMVWAIAGSCIYLAISYWVWLSRYSPHSGQTKLLSGLCFSGAMLAFCRYLIDRREQFDEG